MSTYTVDITLTNKLRLFVV